MNIKAYLVNKEQNDKWLESDCKGDFDYTGRPWAKGYSSVEKAMKIANQNINPGLFEIEDNESGEVWGYEGDGEWEVCFS